MSTYTFRYYGTTETVPEVSGDLSEYNRINIQYGFKIIPIYCFRFFENIVSCTLPDSIIYIGDEAFINTQITSIRIGPNTQIDPGNPFDGANKLRKFTIDVSNPYYAVHGGILYSKDMKTLISYPPSNSMKSFVVPSSVVEIANYSMKNCQILENIVIPVSVKYVGCSFMSKAPNIKYGTIAYYKSKI